MAATSQQVTEWDASGNPIQASAGSGPTEWDASGNPISSKPAPPPSPDSNAGLAPPPAPSSNLRYVPAIDNPLHAVSGAWQGVKSLFTHPVQAAESMGQPFVATGMAPGGMYPTTAPTGRPEDEAANQAVQTSAQASQAEGGQYAVAHPFETAGRVAGPALLTAGVAKAAAPILSRFSAPVEVTPEMDAAALRAMNRPAKSKFAQSDLRAVNASRPYLQGAKNLEDVQARIPQAKAEVWGPYQQAVNALSGKQVMGPDGPTTVGALEQERLELSALNRGLKTGDPGALQLAQQKGLSQADALARESQVQSALDPELQKAGIDPRAIRKTFGQLSQVGSRFSGRTTVAEPTRPTGLGRAANVRLSQPATILREGAGAVQDIAQGKPWFGGKGTDIDVKQAFRVGGEKPDLGQFTPPPQPLALPPPSGEPVPYTIENAGAGPEPDAGSMVGIPATPDAAAVVTPPPAPTLQLPAEAGPEGAGIPPSQPSTAPPPVPPEGRFSRTRPPLAPNPQPLPSGRVVVSPTGEAIPERLALPAPVPKGRAAVSKFAPQGKPAVPPAAESAPAPTLFKPTPKPAAVPEGEPITSKPGSATTLKTPNAEVPASYRLVEASDLQPSHNAQTFAQNPKYPAGVQERTYDTSPEAQARVIDQSQNFDPSYLVNDNPDAVNGPPVVTPDGLVLGGNSRAMSLQRVYGAGAADAYKSMLRDKAANFGLNPADVDSMKEPVLVRQVARPESGDAMRRMGSDLNKSMTGALGTSERAVSAGKSITPDTLRRVSDMLSADDSTLRELLADRGADVVRLLTQDGVLTDRERPQFIDQASGGLNEQGKQFVEKALMGSVIDDPRLMESTPRGVLLKLEKSLGPITSFSSRPDEWNLLPALRQAVAEHGFAQRSSTPIPSYLDQQSLFGGERNPVVDALIRTIDQKPNAVRDAFQAYAKDADQNGLGQARMFGGGEAFDAFNNAFGAKLTPQEYHDGLEEAAGTEPAVTPAPANAPGTQGVSERSTAEAGGGGAPSSSGSPAREVTSQPQQIIAPRSGKAVSIGDMVTVQGRRGRVTGVNPETGKLRVEWE